jgi:gamma-glutamyltranspeptidase/glutathione hydrolase
MVDGWHGVVCSPDHRASLAGLRLLSAGGNAIDAAVAASAVLAVVAQHMCGLGGDLMAVVADSGGAARALVSAGRAGSGASAEAMRADGLTAVPRTGDIRAVTVPGCVDGWLALHSAQGRLPLAQVLEAAVECAEHGFEVSPMLAEALARVGPVAGADELFAGGVPSTGEQRRRPAVAQALRGIVSGGRESWFGGPFGEGLLALGRGLFEPGDFADSGAEWVPTLNLATSHGWLHTVPAPSQGYITLLGAAILDEVRRRHPTARDGSHLQVEAFRAAGHDRAALLGDGFDVAALLTPTEVARRADLVDPRRAMSLSAPPMPGGTVAVVAIDAEGTAVALTQSNSSGFGCRIVVAGLGVWLHNRGTGFSLSPGAPNELRPGTRPAHTLAPLILRTAGGSRVTALATRGGDTQPQILLQLLAQLADGRSLPDAVASPRWMVAAAGRGAFDVWQPAEDNTLRQTVRLEEGVPQAWAPELESAGHDVLHRPFSGDFGHAQVARLDRGRFSGGSDPRAVTGAALTW